jgi:hypothetical protein
MPHPCDTILQAQQDIAIVVDDENFRAHRMFLLSEYPGLLTNLP